MILRFSAAITTQLNQTTKHIINLLMITTMKKNKTNKPLFPGEHNIYLHVNFEKNDTKYQVQGNPLIHEYLLFKLATQEPHFAAALLHAAKNFIEYRSKYC